MLRGQLRRLRETFMSLLGHRSEYMVHRDHVEGDSNSRVGVVPSSACLPSIKRTSRERAQPNRKPIPQRSLENCRLNVILPSERFFFLFILILII